MKEKIIKEVEELDYNNLLGSSTHLLCQDILKYLSAKNLELTRIYDIEQRTEYYSDVILFLYTLKGKFVEKINLYKTSLTTLYEENLFPILKKASYTLVLPEKVLSDIENHALFIQTSLIGFIDYQIQFVLSWSGQNDKDLQELDQEIKLEATKIKLKIQKYERTIYTEQGASDKVALHINSLQRAIKDMNLIGLSSDELDDSMDHYKLLADEIDLQRNMLTNSTEESPSIDSESLKGYFISSFKGMGNGNFNYFDSLIEDLKMERNMKEVAQIAYMIYQSDKLNNRKPNTFADWYRIFCKHTNNTYSINYKPSNLKNITYSLRRIFAYL